MTYSPIWQALIAAGIILSVTKATQAAISFEYEGFTGVDFTGSGIDTSVSSQNPNGCAYIDRILDLKMVSFNTYGRCLTLYSELDCKGEQRIFKGIYPDLAKKGWANKARSIAPLPDNLVCLG
ncbi:uncharacterized protein LOC118433516 [Folsomia candida]|uniref:uncharacterized protein LOC118433516 n=1 Tax=Folsomia candida TaxID=158441 RepID=UPI0016051F13|nr:uncharacterized protein LOC118433516 [Folsomia candida]